MTEFAFLSVLVSMIFGLGLTQVLARTMRHVYAGRATEPRLVYPPDEVGFTDFD